MLVISDTSALSALAEIGLLHVLPQLFDEIVITASVWKECENEKSPPELIEFIASSPEWLIRAIDPPIDEILLSKLDRGEATSIALALAQTGHPILIIDEKLGREAAIELGVDVIGLIGILVSASNSGFADFEAALTSLRTTRFRFAESLIDEARGMLK